MTAERADSDAEPSPGRRGFLRAAAGVSAGALGVGAATTGTASAQEDTITDEGAFPADAPTLGNSDYTGMFVHVGGINQEASTADVSGCEFVESDDAVVAYDVTLIDRASPDTPQADTIMFASVGSDAVEFGRLFIVTGQQSCNSDRVQVALEQVGSADIRDVSENQSAPRTDTSDGGATNTTGPGFGLGAAAAGLLGAGELLRRRG
ncbi:hypothetical protein [Candidatus Halobonum tyrrellensis]|uniref:PGF-CTERM sorting domain-containing protein n=1 Tax=Candidatus Halobonum tyrrellensis G22 TaxID=1324957 RepID=V4HA18_9EURY|nr:hypothetical protein [Candidatus Halobonum tyrrellensis]ESP87560.1 hypothetical protein K933_13846 [Candidatus Halobonum tyrrellensis G22]